MIRVETDLGEVWDSRIGWAALADEAVRAAIASSGYSEWVTSPADIEISVKFTDDDEVQALNTKYRAKDQPTNVLSFPMVEAGLLRRMTELNAGAVLLGDVVLAQGVCASEAIAKGIAITAHASHLLVHGTLHLLGYDHERGEAEADVMEKVERAALAAMNVADPYVITEGQS